MIRRTRALIVLSVLAIAAVAVALEVSTATQPTSKPAAKPAAAKIPDLCRDAIEPYHPGAERARFFRAAGKDSQLAKTEFDASGKAADPFVRVFDSYAVMTAYDKNGNGVIDWFEVEAYRNDFRKRVVAAFDADKDKKLRGPERDAANIALAKGKMLPVAPKPDPGGVIMAAPETGNNSSTPGARRQTTSSLQRAHCRPATPRTAGG